MAEKNRFSRLLKYLLSVSEVKNYTLAQELQYDVSYISKWTSGQMIPSEKSEDKILRGISKCIVEGCGDEGLDKLMKEYQVDNRADLEHAILDNLEEEYSYVKDLQRSSGVDVAPQLFFFPEMKLSDYVARMHHPVLRRVNALDIVGVFDIFSIGREYRFQIVDTRRKHIPKGKWYQDVHYSMVVDVRPDKLNYTYDIYFLVDLLERNSCIDFQLYGTTQAGGRVIFVVKNDYAISGMLAGRDRCISVVASENPDECRVMYRNLQAMCSRDSLLFRKTSMRSMLIRNEYVHALFALKQQWIIGHMTEHFLPEDLFEEIVQKLEEEVELTPELGESKAFPDTNDLRNVYRILKNAVEEFQIRLLIYRTALYNLVVDNELDFFNCKVHLTDRQVVRYLENFLELCRKHPGVEIKMIPGRLLPDVEYNTRPCVFLSDTISYLRLNTEFNNMYIINRRDMREAFGNMFAEFWEDGEGTLITEKEKILINIEHVICGVTGENGE